ncbi:MAG: peptidylprolyl isomerase [Chitinophagaceae bacterium]|nr:peptidylprolyl isomerase [Chitinophagaceae bacterium]
MRYTKLFAGLLSGMALLSGCSSSTTFRQKWTKQKAPEVFKARFETTQGNFDIEARREWSPAGVDRLYQLIKHSYFTNIPVYRVVPNFVAQFGSLDTTQTNPWDKTTLPDEPVKQSNLKGTISFARAGKNTRGHQLYININDNVRLDTSGTGMGVPGFPVVAKLTAGYDSVLRFHSYGDEPRRNLRSQANAGAFLQEKYPKMAYIKKANLLKKGR